MTVEIQPVLGFRLGKEGNGKSPGDWERNTDKSQVVASH